MINITFVGSANFASLLLGGLLSEMNPIFLKEKHTKKYSYI